MKNFFILIIISFFLNTSNIYAEDIREFDIEGISIGDSLLDHYSEKVIKQQLSKTISSYKNNDYIRTFFGTKSPKKYKSIGVHFKKNSKYEIAMINGAIIYRGNSRNNAKKCYKKEKEVVSDLKKGFKFRKVKGEPGVKIKHLSDKSGKSTYTSTRLYLDTGSVHIRCTMWSGEIKKKRRWSDSLRVSLESEDFTYWKKNKAYKGN